MELGLGKAWGGLGRTPCEPGANSRLQLPMLQLLRLRREPPFLTWLWLSPVILSLPLMSLSSSSSSCFLYTLLTTLSSSLLSPSSWKCMALNARAHIWAAVSWRPKLMHWPPSITLWNTLVLFSVQLGHYYSCLPQALHLLVVTFSHFLIIYIRVSFPLYLFTDFYWGKIYVQ